MTFEWGIEGWVTFRRVEMPKEGIEVNSHSNKLGKHVTYSANCLQECKIHEDES